MAEVALAIGMSHVNPVGYGQTLDQVRQRHHVIDDIERVAQRIREVQPDVLLLVSSEHLNSMFIDNMPAYLLGTAESYQGGHWTGLPDYDVAGHRELSMHLLETALRSHFDFARSDCFKLDHGFLMPLNYLNPDRRIPIVPLVQNCFAPPYPSFERSVEVGQFLRQAVEAWPGPERVAIIGAGGLSHWLAVPQMGRVNEAFDRTFLDDLATGDLGRLAGYDSAYVEEQAGNGGHEIRNWVTARAAAPHLRPTVLSYDAIPEIITGFGVALFDGTTA